jgi:hypothetical protein
MSGATSGWRSSGGEGVESTSGQPAEEAAPYREPFRTAIVIATCAAFVATVAILTAGAVVSQLLGLEVPSGTIDP